MARIVRFSALALVLVLIGAGGAVAVNAQTGEEHTFYGCERFGRIFGVVHVDDEPDCIGNAEVVSWGTAPTGGGSEGATEAFIRSFTTNGFAADLPTEDWQFGVGLADNLEANLALGFEVDTSQYPLTSTYTIQATMGTNEPFGEIEEPIVGCVRLWDGQTDAAVPGSEVCHTFDDFGPSGYEIVTLESTAVNLTPGVGRYAVQTRALNADDEAGAYAPGATNVQVHVDW